ncbi:MAG: hypothetical protein LBL47_02860 [Lactobacillus sp.]|nr:hypothetical protein [Lactobacillus sp.]
MIAFSFFISVFGTIIWLIYSIANIGDNLRGMSFSSLPIQEASLQILMVVLPIFIIWLIFGYVMQFINNQKVNGSLLSLFRQVKKNQDYTDLIARIMLEAEREIKDGFVLNRFDLFIADINELLSDVIYLSNIASNEQIDRLWKKVQNGGKWAFGKVIVEVNSVQPNFPIRLFEKSKSNNVLAGTILEFCARYTSLITLLEKHDKGRVFLNIIETGVLGKTFSIMAPIADEVRRSRDIPSSAKIRETIAEEEDDEDFRPKRIYNPEASEVDDKRASIVSKFNIFRRKDEPRFEGAYDEDDQFSAVLERSFSDNPVGEPSFDDEPKVEERIVEERIIVQAQDDEEFQGPVLEPKKAFETNTQRALDSLKKEWEEMKKEDSTSYPFSGWSDEDNYKK